MSTLPALSGPSPTRVAEHDADTAPAVIRRGRGRAPRRGRGRPTKLTPELQDRLVAIVRQVGFLSTAARCCGVPPSLVCEWVARGQGRDPDRPATPVYAEFADAVQQALGEFQVTCLEAINRAALGKPTTWRAAAWSLERAFPLRYGRPRFVMAARTMAAQAVEALLGAAVDVVQRSVRPEHREAELANLLSTAEEIVGDIRGRPWSD